MNSPSEAPSEDLLDTPKALRWPPPQARCRKIRGEASSSAPPSCTSLPSRFPPGITTGVGLLHAAVAWAPTQDA